jgi:hypothetical protein
MEGTVSVDGKPASIGQTVQPRAVVNTGAESLCQLIFDDKNILHISENAVVELDFTTVQKSINLKSGSVAGALKKLAKLTDPKEYAMSIHTPSAVGGVRGTVFFIKVEDPATTYACTCNGTLHYSDPQGGNALTVEAAHHKAYRYAASGGAFTTSDAGVLYHTDQMMELGAAKIGYTIDWTRIEPVSP